MKVALFITCLTDNLYPRAGIAVVRVLEHLGCTVEFPEAQTCCGQPLWNNGRTAETRGLAKLMIDTFADADHVVTPSGSCCSMVQHYYGELFTGDNDADRAWKAKADALAAKTHEFIAFLDRVLHVDWANLGIRWPGTASYHYSCHQRGLGVRPADVERVIRHIDGLDYKPIDKIDQCCGFGGAFAMAYPDISGSLVRDKVACVQAAQAAHDPAEGAKAEGAKASATLISNDAGCTMNIEGACHRAKADVRVITLAEVIAEGLGLLERSDAEAITP